MAKVHPAVGHFLKSAKELDLFDEALALISRGSKPAGKSKGKMSRATKNKIAKAARERWAKARKDKKTD